uniref:RING-type domain-containing protein n=1 Tax=Aegilops tauschii subsp. strangulata TaxID=200361 RepID=A0A453HHA5_AEGTS
PFRNMPSRAAECHIRGEATVSRLLNPHENKRCVVKLLGDLFASYELRKPGSQARGSVRQEAPQGIYEVFPICDPKTTFGSRRACSDAVHRMLKETPVIGDFDLARANWDRFLPDDVTGLVLPGLGDQAGCYDIDISLKIWVKVVDDMAAVEDMAECCICLSDLVEDRDAVRLPGCSHAFHRSCLTPWLHRAKTCPMCRAVMPSHVLYSLMHPPKRQ